MRNFKDKDYAPRFLCSTVKVTEEEYKSKYPKCRVRKDLPKEDGFVFVLIPYERIATDAVLRIWGVTCDTDFERYKTAYIKAANVTLRQTIAPDFDEKLAKADASDAQKSKIRKIAAITKAYQNKLEEKNAVFPKPFSDGTSENVKTNEITAENKDTKKEAPKPNLETKVEEKAEPIKKPSFEELVKNMPSGVPKTDIVNETPEIPTIDIPKTEPNTTPAPVDKTPVKNIVVDEPDAEPEVIIEESETFDNVEIPIIPLPESSSDDVPENKEMDELYDILDVEDPEDKSFIPIPVPIPDSKSAPDKSQTELSLTEAEDIEEIDFSLNLSLDEILDDAEKKEDVKAEEIKAEKAEIIADKPNEEVIGVPPAEQPVEVPPLVIPELVVNPIAAPPVQPVSVAVETSDDDDDDDEIYGNLISKK